MNILISNYNLNNMALKGAGSGVAGAGVAKIKPI